MVNLDVISKVNFYFMKYNLVISSIQISHSAEHTGSTIRFMSSDIVQCPMVLEYCHSTNINRLEVLL